MIEAVEQTWRAAAALAVVCRRRPGPPTRHGRQLETGSSSRQTRSAARRGADFRGYGSRCRPGQQRYARRGIGNCSGATASALRSPRTLARRTAARAATTWSTSDPRVRDLAYAMQDGLRRGREARRHPPRAAAGHRLIHDRGRHRPRGGFALDTARHGTGTRFFLGLVRALAGEHREHLRRGVSPMAYTDDVRWATGKKLLAGLAPGDGHETALRGGVGRVVESLLGELDKQPTRRGACPGNEGHPLSALRQCVGHRDVAFSVWWAGRATRGSRRSADT